MLTRYEDYRQCMLVESHIGPAVVAIRGEQPSPSVDLGEFFSPQFMQQYSEFSTFAEFRNTCPWDFTHRDDIDAIPPPALDQFVTRTTGFDSWRAMRNRAAELELRQQFLL